MRFTTFSQDRNSAFPMTSSKMNITHGSPPVMRVQPDTCKMLVNFARDSTCKQHKTQQHTEMQYIWDV